MIGGCLKANKGGAPRGYSAIGMCVMAEVCRLIIVQFDALGAGAAGL